MELWEIVVLVFGPTGGAWIGVKSSLNGMRGDIKEIKGDVKELRAGHHENRERIIKLESEP